jgi:hypothetical protein
MGFNLHLNLIHKNKDFQLVLAFIGVIQMLCALNQEHFFDIN